jgi:hypothetical protein
MHCFSSVQRLRPWKPPPANPLLTKFSQRANDQSQGNETSTRNNQKLEEKSFEKRTATSKGSAEVLCQHYYTTSKLSAASWATVGSGVPRASRPHAVSKQLLVVFFRGVFGLFRFAFAVRAPISHMCSSLLIKEFGSSDKSCPCIFLLSSDPIFNRTTPFNLPALTHVLP